jgi:hypothetical protein
MSQPAQLDTKGIPGQFWWAAIGGGIGGILPAALAALSISISRGGVCLTLEALIVITGCLCGLIGGMIIKNKVGAAVCGALLGGGIPIALIALLQHNLMWWPLVGLLC